MLVLIRGQMPPNPANPQNKQESLLVNFPTLIPQNKAAREGIMEKLLLAWGLEAVTSMIRRRGWIL